MNKDVIYIEPEDDITDILTGIKNSKTKIVALVPPKKTTVLRSAVNFKLLAKTASDANKVPVLITTDSALLKLAAAANIPVAKNLQTKPEVPSADTPATEPADADDVIDGEEAAAIVADDAGAKKSPSVEDEVVESIDLDDEIATADDADDQSTKKSQKSQKAKKSRIPNLDKYRKFIIMGAAGLALIVGFLIWALVIAPRAHIAVTVRTTSRPFSENISFVTQEGTEDPAAGIFLLEPQKLTKESTVEFEPTGELDKGAKSTGTLTFKRTSASSTYQKAITIAKGAKFTLGDLTFVLTEPATLAELDDSNTDCGYFTPGVLSCKLTKDVTATAKVEAAAPGEPSNVAASATGWAPAGNGYSIASSAMAGGTTKIVKVVSEADIAKAKTELTAVGVADGRIELNENFPGGLMQISSSFKSDSGDPVSTPAIGEEVAEGAKAKLTVKTTFSIYGVDRVRITEFVQKQTEKTIAGEEDQQIYSTGVSDIDEENKAFIESFREVDGKYTARLKTTTKIGPEVTDQMVLDRALGRKIGEVQSLLKSIKGISSVNIDTSVFWVTSIPNNINKVTVEVTVE